MRLAVGKEPHIRVSLHLFRDRPNNSGKTRARGAHLKIRRHSRYRHVMFKTRRGPVFKKKDGRREFWIGWWMNEDGTQGALSGYRLSIHIDQMKRITLKPNHRIPLAPHKPREREEPFEVL